MVNAVKVYNGDFADASLVTHDVSKVDIQAAPVSDDEQEQKVEQNDVNSQNKTNEVKTNESDHESTQNSQSSESNMNNQSSHDNSSYNNHINQYDGNVDINSNITTSNVQAYSVSNDLPTTGSYNEPMDPLTPMYSISIGLLMISAVLIKKSGILD